MMRYRFVLAILVVLFALEARAAEPKGSDDATSVTARILPYKKVKAMSLLQNGDFEEGKGKPYPDHWEPIKRAGISIVDEGGPHGRVVKFELDQATADGPGLMYYSEPIPVVEGKTYVYQVDIKSEAPSSIIFVKGYTMFRGREREIYRKQNKVYLAKGEWGTVRADLTPRSPGGQKVLAHRKIDLPKVDYVKVDLYAYHPKGVIYFDNVAIYEAPEGQKAEESEKASEAK